MSSTNRGGERQRDDWYETPPWAGHAILGTLPEASSSSVVLDPSAGLGALLPIRDALEGRHEERWDALIREARALLAEQPS